MSYTLPQTARLDPTEGYAPHILWSVIILLAANILSLALPLFSLQIYDRILVYAAPGTLYTLSIGTIIAVLIEGAIRICRAYVMGWTSAAFEHVTTTNLMRHTLSIDTTSQTNQSTSEYMQLVGGIGKIRDLYTGRMLILLVDIPFVFLFIGIVAYLAQTLVYVPIAIVILMCVSAALLGQQLSKSLRSRNNHDKTRYDSLIHFLSHIHVIKSLGYESLFERRYERDQYQSSVANYDVALASTHIFDLGIFFARAMIIAILAYGGPLVLEGKITMGILVACVILSGRIIHPVQRTLSFLVQLQESKHAFNQLKKHFEKPQSLRRAVKYSEVKGRVELKNLSYKNAKDFQILEPMNLSLTSGEAIAIEVGERDEKNAFIKIITGLLPPTEGTVEIDGLNPRTLTSEDLTRHIGCLSSTGINFRGTIYENISRYGAVERERVEEMAGLLGIDEEILKMPSGYDTPLDGSRADILSPGFQQRIAIARALILKPHVILFDHADRMLDKSGYNKLYKLLARLKGRVTFILFTNDQNLQGLADRHYRFIDGRLESITKDQSSTLYDIKPYQELDL